MRKITLRMNIRDTERYCTPINSETQIYTRVPGALSNLSKENGGKEGKKEKGGGEKEEEARGKVECES